MNRMYTIPLTVIFVGSLAAAGSKTAPTKPPPTPRATPELVAKGKSLFGTTCAACHGEKGDGTGPAAAALNPKPRNFQTENFKNGDRPDQIFKTIGEGVPGTGMAPFGYLSEGERWALAHFVATLRPAKAK